MSQISKGVNESSKGRHENFVVNVYLIWTPEKKPELIHTFFVKTPASESR